MQVARNSTCAFNLSETASLFKISHEEVLGLLEKRGFAVIGSIDPMAVIKKLRDTCIGKASYRRAALLKRKELEFDCSALTLYAYEQVGVWLPRLSIAQSYYSVAKNVGIYDLQALDLLFTKSHYRNRYIKDPAEGIGHVLLYTGKEFHTVIHASNSKRGIVEERAEQVLYSKNLQRIRRIIYHPEKWITVKIPKDKKRKCLHSDDIFWDLSYGLK